MINKVTFFERIEENFSNGRDKLRFEASIGYSC